MMNLQLYQQKLRKLLTQTQQSFYEEHISALRERHQYDFRKFNNEDLAEQRLIMQTL